MTIDRESLRPLRWDGRTVLSRARLQDAPGTVLVLRPAAEESAAMAEVRLRREHTLAGRLSRDWAAVPLGFIPLQGGTALLLEDPGGDPLSLASTGPLPLARFLRVAASAALALRHMHGSGLIHRDIQPSCLLADAEDRVHLTGFGVACDLPRIRQQASPPALIDGTPAYMAPEQTGRINRSIDARSDLYALGVTFYELLSGRLPFKAHDTLGWFHCHVARLPAPLPASVTASAPAAAMIIMKLLAKAPEERYQTAGGLEADLRRCMGAESPFPLGQNDVPDRILVPERLYGRERELEVLDTALHGLTERGERRMLLVSGPAGIGKSALIEELRGALLPVRGVLATAKCDQYRRDIPYAALAELIQDLVGRVNGATDLQRASWRERIRNALGRNGQVLTNLAPELLRLIGEQPPLPALPPADEARRFQGVVRAFVALVARPRNPLVLFFDDLQWLDRESFALLDALTADLPANMLLAGTYRDAELSPGHPLHGTVAAARQAGVTVNEIPLAPLAAHEMARLVADTLHDGTDAVRPLSDAVAARTGGNPFFAGQFMTGLAEEGLLRFDHAALRWRWDLDGILRKGATENVGALMAERLVRLPEADRDLLVTLACLGGVVSAERLGTAHGTDRLSAQDGLRASIAAGLVVHGAGTYGFAHDRVQEAAYTLLLQAARAARHLRIARRLAAALGPEEPDSAIPPVADQYNRATGQVLEGAERERVAALNLRAARHARASTAYEVASGYFEAGLELLGAEAATSPLGFHLALGAAECVFLLGDQASAETRLRQLLPRAREAPDRAAVASLLITLHTAQDRSDLAVETCLTFLRQAGIAWDPHPGRAKAWQEYAALQADLGDRSVESLSSLPPATSREAQAFMDVLAATLPPAFFTDQDLVCLILCRMARLSLAHGSSEASPLAFAYLGMVLGPYFGDYPAGFRFGLLGYQMVESGALPRYEPRVRMCFGCHVAPWTWPFARTLPLLRRAHDIAVEMGDLTYSGFSACTLVTSLIAAGMPLSEVQAEAEAKLAFVRGIRFGLIGDIITSQIGLLRAMRGLPSDLADPAFEARLEAEPSLAIAACWHWIRRLQAAVHDDDIPLALAAAEKAEPLLWTTDGHIEMAEYHFHAALARAAAEETSAPATPSPGLLRHQEQLHVWAASGPANFAARALLVDAAVATVRGESLSAIRHAEAALRAAREGGLPQIEALAQEWAFRFYHRRELPTPALAHLREARKAYLGWGATAKVQRLDSLHRELTGGEPSAAVPAPSNENPALDVESLVRSSQAVSGEAGLPALMRTLMVTVLEHAGATRGLLVLPRAGELRAAAEARAGSRGIEVTFPDAPLASSDAPLSILGRTMQEMEPVLIGDAAKAQELTADAYLVAHPTRALLCLPLLRQTKLMGLLYLENGLTPHAFTEARLAVLRLLASQAAISLGNAALEEKEALLKEMHHRVKNNLQLISSLLNLQAARIEDPQVAALFSESRDRVRSIALVHENLYHAGDYTRVSMRRHLGSLCAQLQSAYRCPERDVAVVTDLADLHLDLDKAVSCGLIVNELIANAFKHGFAGRSTGEIRVTLSEAGTGRARLSVRDDGNGFPDGRIPDPETAETLGLQLVGDLAHQLRGEITLGTNPGADLAILFPLGGAR